VWTSVGNTGADPYASWVFRTIRKYFPEMRGRVDMSDGDEDKEAGFVVLRKTIMPAILVEMAFISNPEEEQMLAMPEFRMRMAAAIAEGIRNVRG
jgi:N-acetylmuramoyl-L-alanine amidase